MSYKANDPLLEAILGAVKTELDGGLLFIFAGEAPAAPDDALNMAGVHCQVAEISLTSTSAGISFDAPAGDTLAKAAAEVWSGLVLNDGYDSATALQTPTFFRFCADTDDGRGAGTLPRIQGTVGGPASSADLKLGAATTTDNGTNAIAVSVFNVRIGMLG